MGAERGVRADRDSWWSMCLAGFNACAQQLGTREAVGRGLHGVCMRHSPVGISSSPSTSERPAASPSSGARQGECKGRRRAAAGSSGSGSGPSICLPALHAHTWPSTLQAPSAQAPPAAVVHAHRPCLQHVCPPPSCWPAVGLQLLACRMLERCKHSPSGHQHCSSAAGGGGGVGWLQVPCKESWL